MHGRDGFGLLGHQSEMVQGSDVFPALQTGCFDLIPSRWSMRAWRFTGGHVPEPGICQDIVDVGQTTWPSRLLYDPQIRRTFNGGWTRTTREAMFNELRGAVPVPNGVGVVEEYKGGKRVFCGKIRNEQRRRTWSVRRLQH
jgi:hypothetical protein